MIDETRRNSRVVGVAATLALHVVVAAVLLSVGLGSPARPGPDTRRFRDARREFDSSPGNGRPPAKRREPGDARADSGQPRGAVGASGSAVMPPDGARAYARPQEPVRLDAARAAVAATFARSQPAAENALLNHLWQSTLFALAVGILTLAFRKYDARVRYWMWLAASVKFLVPFSLLVQVGTAFPLGPSDERAGAASLVSSTIAGVSQPFVGRMGAVLPTGAPANEIDWLVVAAIIAWFLGAEFIVIMRWRAWHNVRAARLASRPFTSPTPRMLPAIEIRATPALLEPGVVGFLRPVLLMPAGIEEQLSGAELAAVVEHEACHIRCRDNLTGALHMLVEIVFWFHPLVWWIGGRMLKERERACDEEVLRAFPDPRAYADGIVNVCKRYVEARLACVPGVSSSDLRQRIERIMRNDIGDAMARWQKIALAMAAVAVLVFPVGIGAIGTPVRVSPQAAAPPAAGGRGADTALAFQAASVKQNTSGAIGTRLDPQTGGRFTATNATLALLIRYAYDLPDFQVTGGPAWLAGDRFDIVASADGNPSLPQQRLMLRRLLNERFKLASHTETRTLPTYTLVMARSDRRLGAGLRRTDAPCDASGSALFPGIGPPRGADTPRCGFFGFSPDSNFPAGRGGLAFRGLTMDGLARTLVTLVHRNVNDRTGLSGYFDGDFDFVAELPPPPPPPGLPNPFTTPFVSTFTALPEQLGLKLNSDRGPVDILVIESAQHPTDD